MTRSGHAVILGRRSGGDGLSSESAKQALEAAFNAG
jgi:hypothetical protein